MRCSQLSFQTYLWLWCLHSVCWGSGRDLGPGHPPPHCCASSIGSTGLQNRSVCPSSWGGADEWEAGPPERPREAESVTNVCVRALVFVRAVCLGGWALPSLSLRPATPWPLGVSWLWSSCVLKPLGLVRVQVLAYGSCSPIGCWTSPDPVPWEGAQPLWGTSVGCGLYTLRIQLGRGLSPHHSRACPYVWGHGTGGQWLQAACFETHCREVGSAAPTPLEAPCAPVSSLMSNAERKRTGMETSGTDDQNKGETEHLEMKQQ